VHAEKQKDGCSFFFAESIYLSFIPLINLILLSGTGAPSVHGGKIGLKPDQGMTLRRLLAGCCLVLNKIIGAELLSYR